MDHYQRLLLYFLRLNSGKSEGFRPDQLSDTDWETLVQESTRQGVMAFLYHRLKTVYATIPVPTASMEKLRNAYFISARRNILLYHKIGLILQALRDDNISVIALKGAHLAELVYGNIALRPMSDIDILVHEEDLGKAEATLHRNGFTPVDCNRVVGEGFRHFAYRHQTWGLLLEVHWSILSSGHPFNIDVDGQWKRSVPVTLAGVETLVLCPEDLLFHLCLHISEDGFQFGTKPLCDISEAIRHYGKNITWDEIEVRSRQWEIERCVYLTLKLVRDLLGAPIPDVFFKTLKPNDFDDYYIAIAMNQIFPTRTDTSHGDYISSNIAQLSGSKSILEKVSIFIRTVFPSRVFMTRKYPTQPDSLRIYLYYPLRIVDLLQRYGKVIWWLLRRNQKMLDQTRSINDVTALKEWMKLVCT